MLRSMLVKICVLLAVVLSAPLAWLGWRYYTGRPAYLLRRGQQAVAAGTDAEAWRVAQLLDKKGHPAAAHLLRGWMWLRHARLEQQRQPDTSEDASLLPLAGRLVAASAGFETLPPLARSAAWITAALVPLPAPRVENNNAEFVRALDEFSRIQDDGKIGDEATVRAAECLLQLGARRFATEALNDLVERRPEVMAAHRWLAAIYIDLNAADKALPHLRAWGRLDPTDGRPDRWIGFFIREDKRYDEAVAAYREALERRLDDRVRHEVRQELADTLAEFLHDYQQALAVLDAGPEAFRRTPEALALRTRCLADLGRSSDADATIEQALRRYPHDQKLLALRGELYWQMDRAAEAVKPLEAAAVLDPYNERLHQQLAQVYQLIGKADLARKQRAQAEQAHRLQDHVGELYGEAKQRPWDAEVRYQMGLLCLKMHQFDKAATWLRAALACDPQHTAAHLALAEAIAAGRAGGVNPLKKDTRQGVRTPRSPATEF